MAKFLWGACVFICLPMLLLSTALAAKDFDRCHHRYKKDLERHTKEYAYLNRLQCIDTKIIYSDLSKGIGTVSCKKMRERLVGFAKRVQAANIPPIDKEIFLGQTKTNIMYVATAVPCSSLRSVKKAAETEEKAEIEAKTTPNPPISNAVERAENVLRLEQRLTDSLGKLSENNKNFSKLKKSIKQSRKDIMESITIQRGYTIRNGVPHIYNNHVKDEYGKILKNIPSAKDVNSIVDIKSCSIATTGTPQECHVTPTLYYRRGSKNKPIDLDGDDALMMIDKGERTIQIVSAVKNIGKWLTKKAANQTIISNVVDKLPDFTEEGANYLRDRYIDSVIPLDDYYMYKGKIIKNE